jgi:hypothetical protein
MKKMTTRKNPKGQRKTLKCPHCGKSFHNAQGLSGHLRSQHPSQNAPTTPVPDVKQKGEVGAPALPSTGAHEHLRAAFAVLSQRNKEIDEAITRLEALKAEKETVRRKLEAVNAALEVFGKHKLEISEAALEMELAQGSLRLENQHAVDAKTDRPPEFTGNKTELVRAVVQSRGSVGAAPKDIDQIFTERGIEKSKNAIYNALFSLVKQKKLKKKDGQYFSIESPGSKATV